MSKSTSYGNIDFICDNCGVGLATDTKDWSLALEVLKAEDWIIDKDDDSATYQHYCSVCSQ